MPKEIQQCLVSLPPIPVPNQSIEPNMSLPPISSPNQSITPEPCAVVSSLAEVSPVSTVARQASSGQLGIIPRFPTDNRTVTSPFSQTRIHPVSGRIKRHLGTDLRAAYGERFYAALDGKINYQVNMNEGKTKRDITAGYGLYAYIKHTIYSSEQGQPPRTFFTLYGHMKKDFPEQTIAQWQAKSGKQVKMGQVIGLSGNTGQSTGDHLHFEYNPSSTAFSSSTKKDPMVHFLGKTFYKS